MSALAKSVVSPFGAAPQLVDVVERFPSGPAPEGDLQLPDPWLDLAEIDVGRAVAANRRLAAWQSGRAAIPFDALRTKLQIQSQEHGWKRVAVTSATPGTGKSTLVANLALAFARSATLRVLVLDLHQNKPALGSLLSITPRWDISDVLTGTHGLERQGHRIGRSVALSFSQIRHRGLLDTMEPGQIDTAITELTSRFNPDLTLIDLPSIYIENGTYGFLAHVDAAIAVARQNHSRIAELDQCERDISAQTRFAGFVVTQA